MEIRYMYNNVTCFVGLPNVNAQMKTLLFFLNVILNMLFLISAIEKEVLISLLSSSSNRASECRCFERFQPLWGSQPATNKNHILNVYFVF